MRFNHFHWSSVKLDESRPRSAPRLTSVEFTETGRRIRAARSYAGFQGRKDFSDAIEMSEATLVRLERGDRTVKRRELREIAEICDVPMWFLEEGWDGWRSTSRGGDQIDAEAQEAEEGLRRDAGGARPEHG